MAKAARVEQGVDFTVGAFRKRFVSFSTGRYSLVLEVNAL